MDPKGDNILALTTHLSKLEKVKNTPKSTTTHNKPTGCGCYNRRVKYPNKSYVEVLDNIES